MVERRKLLEGLNSSKPVDPEAEKAFVYTGKPKPDLVATQQALTEISITSEAKPNSSNTISRVPLTTRIRGDFATALKRASLERQLKGVKPNTMLDILEEALEPWLRQNGYLS